ncbi:MAG: hypothetical protein KJO87_09635, partial [Acidimicrobiia bacterium]|nr:hypothetical protein [Acidimicrobiia bacterium]
MGNRDEGVLEAPAEQFDPERVAAALRIAQSVQAVNHTLVTVIGNLVPAVVFVVLDWDGLVASYALYPLAAVALVSLLALRSY